jgi:hypothetical protein
MCGSTSIGAWVRKSTSSVQHDSAASRSLREMASSRCSTRCRLSFSTVIPPVLIGRVEFAQG